MPGSIYEMRSKEVQEILDNPPRHIILFGNSIVLLLLVCGILLINRLKIPNIVTLQGRVLSVELPKSPGTPAMLTVQTEYSTEISGMKNASLDLYSKTKRVPGFELRNVTNGRGSDGLQLTMAQRDKEIISEWPAIGEFVTVKIATQESGVLSLLRKQVNF